MPTYNEVSNIGVMIEDLFNTVFPGIPGMEMHLVVVDDDSPDGTGDIVRRKMPQFPNLHLLTGKKAGLGAAYVRGMSYAMEHLRADALIGMDADLLQRISSLSNRTVEIPLFFAARVRERTKFGIREAAAILGVLLRLSVRQACG